MIHIISHRRSGSKSLGKALGDSRVPKALRELLHVSSCHEYKFSQDSTEPFSKGVYFRTHPNFRDTQLINFLPRFKDGGVSWVLGRYMETYNPKYAFSIADLCCANLKLPVIKTQYGYLYHKVGYTSNFLYERFKTFIEGQTLITLRPIDLARWIASNWACDNSGVFVPISEQLSYVVPKVIPTGYVRDMLSQDAALLYLLCHIDALHLATETLNTSQCEIAQYAGLCGPIEDVQEYRSLNYAEYFSNYCEVEDEVKHYRVAVRDRLRQWEVSTGVR